MYRLNKKNPIVRKLMELDDAISEYFALKHCNPEAVSTNDISEIAAPRQDLVKAITEYESELPSDRRERPKELLSA
jgi:hypothetical protein